MHRTASALYLLENSAACLPNNTAVVDDKTSLTYAELEVRSKRVGSALSTRDVRGRSVIVAMEKSCDTVCVMMGALYAGASYVPVDLGMPADRLEHILRLLGRPVVVSDTLQQSHGPLLKLYAGEVIDPSELLAADVDEGALDAALKSTLETDPAYILFTSGSTGVPKGVAVSHRAIRSFVGSFVDTLGLRSDDRLANQAPFDFDVSVKDLYGAFAAGATVVIVPRALFMQPLPLVRYLEEHEVSVMVWAVAALCIVSTYHALGQASLHPRIVAFSGEVMPLKHLRAWRKALPNTTFYNLYGPTEITCNCLYHRLEDGRDYAQGIPLGMPFSHCDVRLVDGDGNEVTQPDIEGEIIVRGPSLALGYVGLPEQTELAFTQNPLNDRYPDRVYHTGDLALRTQTGELFFRGRKDNQIKYQGHRIELEEIDMAIERVGGVRRCRCVFDDKRKRLYGFFEGEATEQSIREYVAQSLPVHMRPTQLRKIDDMPLTKNGKVDRAKLLELASSRGRSRRREAQ